MAIRPSLTAQERERPKFSTPVIRTKEDKVFFSTILKVDINRFSSFLAERESLLRSNQMAGLDDEDTFLLYYLFASWWTASEKIKIKTAETMTFRRGWMDDGEQS